MSDEFCQDFPLHAILNMFIVLPFCNDNFFSPCIQIYKSGIKYPTILAIPILKELLLKCGSVMVCDDQIKKNLIKELMKD